MSKKLKTPLRWISWSNIHFAFVLFAVLFMKIRPVLIQFNFSKLKLNNSRVGWNIYSQLDEISTRPNPGLITSTPVVIFSYVMSSYPYTPRMH